MSDEHKQSGEAQAGDGDAGTFGGKPTIDRPEWPVEEEKEDTDGLSLSGMSTMDPHKVPSASADWLGLALSGGRYHITAKLGEGGMGVVYRAEDRNLGNDAVVKVPHPQLLRDRGFAALTGQTLAEADGSDSYNVLPELLGEAKAAPCREYLIEQNNSGTAMALRKGPWKYVPGHAGGKAARRKKATPEKPSEAVADRDLPPAGGELYNLADDLSEKQNVAADYPQLTAEMAAKLGELKGKGRSRP